ncbi:MAG TPA: DinB family protein [Terriglobales bacterium]|jgi:hypothetical protein
MPDISDAYLDDLFRSLRGHKRLADNALVQLNDQQFFAAPDAGDNSVAIIVKHVAGNLHSRFTDFLTSDGEKADRNRDQEFEIAKDATREQIMSRWEQHWQLLFETINSLQADDLERTITIRAQPHTVFQALQRAMSHLAYHIGQIVWLAKHWKGAEWQSLSVPKGQSEQFRAKMIEKYKAQP